MSIVFLTSRKGLSTEQSFRLQSRLTEWMNEPPASLLPLIESNEIAAHNFEDDDVLGPEVCYSSIP